ncbi:MAG: Nif3-like dinuclear metal center hexameric protein [Bacteroidetes bacterium]|nr:Nif3-like dinuclear metal center hexameric protein [Bacteroidota bacterium]MDA1223822.1 Nif3-like dinuclear metal center hexameric protein [Bacteroidota bacterium]
MLRIHEIVSAFEAVAPLALQESYDNSGLIVGDRDAEVTRALLCLDCTEAVVDEAIGKGCDIIIAHHPIVFGGLKRFTGGDYVQRTVIKAIQNNIAIYACHTNLDNVLRGGVNERIAQQLGFDVERVLRPIAADFGSFANQGGFVDSEVFRTAGPGVLCNLQKPMNVLDFLQHVKERMGAKVVKYTKCDVEVVGKVAICGGAGSFLIGDALRAGADAFITSDVKYHEFFDAQGKMLLCDIGHYESEKYTIDLFSNILSAKFPKFATIFAGTITNPIDYLT